MKKILIFILIIFVSCGKPETTNVIVVIDGVDFNHMPEIEGYIKSYQISDTGTYTTAGFHKLYNTYHYPLITGKEKLSFITPNQKNRSDRKVYHLAKGRSGVIVGFHETDIRAHNGDWEGYLDAIDQAIEYALLLDADVITTDHGRHCDDYVNHGDDCECCKKLIYYLKQ